MLLAEALQNRADLQRRITQLSDRIAGCVLVQEGGRNAAGGPESADPRGGGVL